MSVFFYENNQIKIQDNEYSMKDIFEIYNYDNFEEYFETNEDVYYSLDELVEEFIEDNEKELINYLKLFSKELNVFDFIKLKNYNLNLGKWFQDIWYPLFEKKSVLITNEILNFIHYGISGIGSPISGNYNPGAMIIAPEIINKNKRNLLIILQNNKINYQELKYNDPVSLQYDYIQNEIKT